MRLRAEALRRLLPACCGALLLAGCVTTRVSHELLAVPAQEALLRGLAGFRLNGRAAVRAGDEGFNATLSWQQRLARSEVRLSGPVGAGGVTLDYGPGSLSVTTSRGEQLKDDQAEQQVSGQLGFVPPFDALRYWVLGLTAPGEPAMEVVTGGTGRIAEMTQQGWHIRYDRWTEQATPAGAVRLPQRLTATRDDLRLRLVVDRWKLRVTD